MYSLLGPAEILKTLYILSYPYLEVGQNHTTADLELGLRKHLVHRQPSIIRTDTGGIHILTEGEQFAHLLELLEIEEETNVPDAMPRNLAVQKVQDAISRLQLLDPQLGEIFHLVTHTVLVTTRVKSPGSASTPAAVGVMWMQPTPDWTGDDYLEALIHEMTHNCLGFDEHCYQHYTKPKALLDESTWVASAIRKEPRPINAVIHSIFVANEIIKVRTRWGNLQGEYRLHGSSEALFGKIREALDALLGQKKSYVLLRPRMRNLVAQVDSQLQTLS